MAAGDNLREDPFTVPLDHSHLYPFLLSSETLVSCQILSVTTHRATNLKQMWNHRTQKSICRKKIKKRKTWKNKQSSQVPRRKHKVLELSLMSPLRNVLYKQKLMLWKATCTCKCTCEHGVPVHKAWRYHLLKKKQILNVTNFSADHKLPNPSLLQKTFICYCLRLTLLIRTYTQTHIYVCSYRNSVYFKYINNVLFLGAIFSRISGFFFLSYWLSNYFFRELKHFSRAGNKDQQLTSSIIS